METNGKVSRTHRTESEIKEILKDYEENDLSVKDFCELYSISEQTLYNWRSKYHSKSAEETTGFIAMELGTASSPGLFAELEVPGKMILRLYQAVTPDFLKTFM
jgi:hypothetical protein